jgi:hypothetical protein
VAIRIVSFCPGAMPEREPIPFQAMISFTEHWNSFAICVSVSPARTV